MSNTKCETLGYYGGDLTCLDDFGNKIEKLIRRATAQSTFQEINLKVGQTLFASFKASSVKFIPEE